VNEAAFAFHQRPRPMLNWQRKPGSTLLRNEFEQRFSSHTTVTGPIEVPEDQGYEPAGSDARFERVNAF
jgi:hypothetical protein